MTGAGEGFVIRPMVAADLARALAIASSLRHAPHWPRSAYLAAFDPAATPRRVAVAADGDSATLAGFAVASLVGREAELETIVVSRESQRRGLGRMLLEALFGKLRTAGIGEVSLEVRASNQAGLGLYGRAGFGETGRRASYYADPVEDAIVMRLFLS